MSKRILLVAVILSIVILGVSVFSKKSDAKETETEPYKYYTSYTIEPGDTLYGIATKYMEMYPDVKEVHSLKSYTVEIADLNNLGTTKIISNQHLIIPYYERELH